MIRILPFLLLLSSCAIRSIQVQHEYLDRRYLASSYAHTIDPRSCSYCGEMLIIRWRLPRACMKDQVKILLTLRFRNGEVEEVVFPIRKRWGSVCYRLMNPQWACKGGILTYKIEIQGDEVLQQFEHQIWTERVEVSI